MKKCLLMLSGIVATAGMLFAQPVNDKCSGAVQLTYYNSEAEATLVEGDTRNTVDASTDNVPVCSANFYRDDVWYVATAPAVLPDAGIAVKVYYTGAGTDIASPGMALYSVCDTGAANQPFFCGNSPAGDQAVTLCVGPNESFYIRVWSADGDASNWQAGQGTFRIAVFAVSSPDVVLWSENFSNGLTGWNTYGTCGGDPDSNMNAVWRYYPDGVIDQGAYANAGVGVTGSLTPCNGGVGVDSDYDDNGGVAGAFGTGPCPTGDMSQYILESPVLAHGSWGVAGISIKWIQGIREYSSDYFVGYRIFENDMWSDWVSFQVNEDDEFPLNSAHFNNNPQRVFLGGAQNGDSLQIRFVYNANYYYWGIDDIRLIEAPCNDMRSMSNFYAIAPAALMPVDQIVPWYPLNDVYNAGACEQTGVNLNFTLMNSSGVEVYNENLAYGTVPGDSLVENVNFPSPVMIPKNMGADTYTGTYTLTADNATEMTDYDFSDNTNTIKVITTNGEYALDNGSTRSLAPAGSNYDAGAPYGYVYGSYFYFPKGSQYKVTSVLWGANNAATVAGLPINLILFKWTDVNQNEQVESSEREIIGFTEVVFDGTEPDNSIFENTLENFNNPGADIYLEDNSAYLMVMEYRAQDQTSFFVLASEEYDYSAVVLSSAQAGMPTYASVLGLSADGNVDGIDYGVDAPGTFGFDIVPVMHLNMTKTDVKDVLPEDNFISVFPNPASEKVNLNLEFTQRMQNVQVIMTDAAGKTVTMDNYRDLDNTILEYDVSRLTPGAYMVNVSTEKGSRAVPFIVQR